MIPPLSRQTRLRNTSNGATSTTTLRIDFFFLSFTPRTSPTPQLSVHLEAYFLILIHSLCVSCALTTASRCYDCFLGPCLIGFGLFPLSLPGRYLSLLGRYSTSSVFRVFIDSLGLAIPFERNKSYLTLISTTSIEFVNDVSIHACDLIIFNYPRFKTLKHKTTQPLAPIHAVTRNTTPDRKYSSP